MGNTFGHLFRITTYGESHGGGVGVIIDGCPPLVEISAAEIQVELDRRRPGQSKITTPRKETDTCEILSGVFEGKTTGTPISILVRNQDARSQDYSEMVQTYRPSHADATYDAKYGIRNWQGGGRSSARETIGRVAAGAIAKKILQIYNNVEVIGYVKRIQDIEATVDSNTVTLADVESNIVRCPDLSCADLMIDRIEAIGRSAASSQASRRTRRACTPYRGWRRAPRTTRARSTAWASPTSYTTTCRATMAVRRRRGRRSW